MSLVSMQCEKDKNSPPKVRTDWEWQFLYKTYPMFALENYFNPRNISYLIGDTYLFDHYRTGRRRTRMLPQFVRSIGHLNNIYVDTIFI